MIHLYYHVGSGNHGCEAIVRSTVKMLGQPMTLWSVFPEEDYAYRLNEVIKIDEDKAEALSKMQWKYYYSAISHKLTGNDYRFIQMTHSAFRKAVKPGDICLSIGGDNYCYSGTDILGYYNRMLRERGAKTVLWGCSIEPDCITDSVKRDLMSYDLITARDSLTYEGLINRGIDRNVILCADPAFLLDTAQVKPINGFRKDNTVGINIGPLVTEMSSIVLENYIELIRYIINKTTDNILLIPHVVKRKGDDRIVLRKIMTELEGNSRITMIKDCNCMNLKGYIAGCRIFIGARTHSVIAAYSSCVPTLAVGYSIKAKGIAKDIFGSYDKYVVPVENMTGMESLLNAYRKITDSSEGIEKYLQEEMPTYRQKAVLALEAMKRVGLL